MDSDAYHLTSRLQLRLASARAATARVGLPNCQDESCLLRPGPPPVVRRRQGRDQTGKYIDGMRLEKDDANTTGLWSVVSRFH